MQEIAAGAFNRTTTPTPKSIIQNRVQAVKYMLYIIQKGENALNFVVNSEAGKIELNSVTVSEIRTVLGFIKFKAGPETAQNCACALQNLLSWAADFGYQGGNILLELPEALRKCRDVVLDVIISNFGRGSPEFVDAESLCNKLINYGFQHGEKIRKFEFLRDRI